MIGPKVAPLTAREEAEAYELVELRDGGRCLFHAWDCAGEIQRDHRKNRSQGGRTELVNLQQLCAKHHQWKTDHPKEACDEAWGVPGWADPATYPGRRWCRHPRGFYSVAFVLYLPTLDDTRKGFTIITPREARRRIAEGVLYESGVI